MGNFTNDDSFDICVIGGGASGFMAAITAARLCASGKTKAPRIVICEKGERVLKKLLATGNGRCNFTNAGLAGCERYIGEEPQFAAPALEAFNADDAIAFFRTLGIEPYEGAKGRIYPRGLQASAVADAMRFEAERLGITVLTDTRAETAVKTGGKFFVTCAGRRLSCGALAAACGGLINGSPILRGFGHSITKITPVLSQLLSDDPICASLRGVKAEGAIAAIAVSKGGERLLAREAGDILFCENGISGDAAFALSIVCHKNPKFELSIDLLPEIPQDELRQMLRGRAKTLAHLQARDFLAGLVNKRAGYMIMKRCGLNGTVTAVSELGDTYLDSLAHGLKDTRIPIKGAAGFKTAQAAAGGADAREFCPESMESRLVPGLFACGEALDITGECGGYNLHWAWASGYLAGTKTAALFGGGLVAPD